MLARPYESAWMAASAPTDEHPAPAVLALYREFGFEVDAEVMIHEELIHYIEKGLVLVSDLGAAWCKDTGLPLPVGLNLVSKRFDMELSRDIAATCQRSLLWGYENSPEVYSFASKFGRGMAKEHIEMFRIEDFLRLPEDVREAMKIMFGRVASMKLGPTIDSFEIVEGLDSPERLLVKNQIMASGR